MWPRGELLELAGAVGEQPCEIQLGRARDGRMLSRLGAGLVGKGRRGQLFSRGPKPAHLGECAVGFLFVDEQGLVARQVECGLITCMGILASHRVETGADG